MQNIVGVQFTTVGKVYYFEPKGIKFAVGDGVIVETAQGVEYGKITIANSEMPDDKIVGSLKPVMRKATDKDTKTHETCLAKGKSAMAEGKARIAKHGLDMKLVDVEYAFDSSKIIFYFTSENRVDFRELVKDLAGHFKNRIELKQIGIRDECKQKGGLGPCGRPCCCNSYMVDFERVSIKMAKNQGLSLNPTKISGLCGRLMCCLNFEDEYYKETLKFMPKFGSNITSAEGKGYVDHVDMLRQNVRVKFTLNSGETETRTYNIKQLAGSGSEYTVVKESTEAVEAEMPTAVLIADQVGCDQQCDSCTKCDSCDKCSDCIKCANCRNNDHCSVEGKARTRKNKCYKPKTTQGEGTVEGSSDTSKPSSKNKRGKRGNKPNNNPATEAKPTAKPAETDSTVATDTAKPKNKHRRNRHKKKPNNGNGGNGGNSSTTGGSTAE